MRLKTNKNYIVISGYSLVVLLSSLFFQNCSPANYELNDPMSFSKKKNSSNIVNVNSNSSSSTPIQAPPPSQVVAPAVTAVTPVNAPAPSVSAPPPPAPPVVVTEPVVNSPPTVSTPVAPVQTAPPAPAPVASSTNTIDLSKYGKVYYVSPSGTNTNTGLSVSSPFATITKALSLAIKGDAVFVFSGSYNEKVRVSKNGITLSAYPGESPVIDGGTNLPGADWSSLVRVSGNDNIFSGFEIKNCNINGAFVGGYGLEVTGTRNLMSHLKVHHSWETGVLIKGDYNTVEDSEVYQNSFRHSFPADQASATSGWASGMSAARNSSSTALIPTITSFATFRRNKVYNNWGEGLSCFEADSCTIEDNIVYDNWTVNLYLSDTSNSIVQRNIVYVSSNPEIIMRYSKPPGITLADEVSTKPRSVNNKVINNLIYNTSLSAFSWTQVNGSGLKDGIIAFNTIVDGPLDAGGSSADGIVNSNSQIRNNIILGTTSTIKSTTGITFSNNNWQKIPTILGSTNVSGDPKILRTGLTTHGDLTAEYFKIGSSSVAINSGITISGIVDDFLKNIRSNSPSLGAFEF